MVYNLFISIKISVQDGVGNRIMCILCTYRYIECIHNTFILYSVTSISSEFYLIKYVQCTRSYAHCNSRVYICCLNIITFLCHSPIPGGIDTYLFLMPIRSIADV